MCKRSCFTTTFASQWLTSPKHCHGSILIQLFHHFKINWVGKRLSKSNLKSHDCLVTHCLQMTSFLVLIRRISRNQFKCNHLRQQKFSVKFSLRFWNLHIVLDILKRIWFSKMFKLICRFQKQNDCIWIVWGKSRLLAQEYLPAVVNVLTKSPKNSYLTRRDVS